MLTKSEIKRNLLGTFEICLLMTDADKRFHSDSKEALRSFIIPALFFPLSIFIFFLEPEMGAFNGSPDNFVVLLYCLRYTFALGFFLLLMYYLSKTIRREQYFWKFVSANNWLTIPRAILFTPIAVLLLQGGYSHSELAVYLTAAMVYSYVCMGFIAMIALRIPWKLAGFIVFISLAINEGSYKVLLWVGEYI